MPDDAELLRHFATTHADAAFAELARRHLDSVYSAALRRVGGDTHLAEDVTQHVFLVLAQKAAAAARHPALGAWLYTITRFEAAHAVRRERRRKAREQHAQQMNELQTDDGAAVDWSRVAPLLDEVIDQLPAADQLAIVLRFVERRAFAEIGMALRVSEDAARVRLDRALEKLRLALERRGVTSTAAALTVSLSINMVVAAPAQLASTIGAAAASGLTGASAATALSFLYVMNLTKLTTCLAVLGIALALWERHAAANAESARAAAEDQNGAFRAQINVLAERAKAAEARRVATPTSGAMPSAVTVPSESVPGADVGAALAANKSAAEMQFLTDSELQRLAAEQFRASLALRYGPLYVALRLSDAQRVEFERLAEARHEAEFSLGRERILQGLSKTDPTFVAKREALVGPMDAQLRSLLGEEGFGQMQQFDRATPVRGLVDAVAGNVYYSSSPLTREQGQQLTEVFAAASRRQRGGRVEWTDLNWDAAAARAQAILTPAQFAALKALHDEATLQQAAKQRMENPTGR